MRPPHRQSRAWPCGRSRPRSRCGSSRSQSAPNRNCRADCHPGHRSRRRSGCRRRLLSSWPTSAQAKPSHAIAPSPSVPPVDVNRALDRAGQEFEFPAMPLLAFVQLAGQMVCGAPLTLDAMRAANWECGSTLRWRCTNTTFRWPKCSSHVLTPHGLMAEVWQGQLIVTSSRASVPVATSAL